MYELLDDLLRGRVQVQDLDPLEVLVVRLDGQTFLFSQGTQRLEADGLEFGA